MRKATAVIRRLLWVFALAGCGPAANNAATPLRIDGFSPDFLDFRRGGLVTITGAGFTSETTVLVDGAPVAVASVQPDSLDIELAPTGRAARALIVAKNGEEEARAGHRLTLRGMDPEALLFVDDGAVAPGPVDGVLPLDFDGDGALDLAISAAESRWLKGDGKAGFAAGIAIPGRVIGAVRFGSSRQDLLVIRTDTGIDVAKLDGETVARAKVDGVTNPQAFVAKDGSAFLVADGLAGRALFRLRLTDNLVVAAEVLPLGAFAVASLDVAGSEVLLGGTQDGPRLLVGDDTGAFRDAPAGTFPSRIAGKAEFVDVDADGVQDVVVAGRVLLRGAASFVDRTGATAGRPITGAVAFTDLDADGATDVLGATPGISVQRNDGTGRFFDYTSLAAPTGVRAFRPVSAADLDGDGDADVLAVDAAGRLHVLENWAPKPFTDPDHDGAPSSRDVCPDKPDADQRDSDAFPFGCRDAADCLATTTCTLVKPGTGRAWLICGGPSTFAEAERFCRTRGATIAVPKGDAEARTFGAAVSRAWIGLSDRAVEGQFRDPAGATPTYTAWRAGEPNDAGANEDCAETDAAGGWNDIPCDLKLAFACEDAETRTPDGRGDACDNCPLVSNPGQEDANANGIGDACEAAP